MCLLHQDIQTPPHDPYLTPALHTDLALLIIITWTTPTQFVCLFGQCLFVCVLTRMWVCVMFACYWICMSLWASVNICVRETEQERVSVGVCVWERRERKRERKNRGRVRETARRHHYNPPPPVPPHQQGPSACVPALYLNKDSTLGSVCECVFMCWHSLYMGSGRIWSASKQVKWQTKIIIKQINTHKNYSNMSNINLTQNYWKFNSTFI